MSRCAQQAKCLFCTADLPVSCNTAVAGDQVPTLCRRPMKLHWNSLPDMRRAPVLRRRPLEVNARYSSVHYSVTDKLGQCAQNDLSQRRCSSHKGCSEKTGNDVLCEGAFDFNCEFHCSD